MMKVVLSFLLVLPLASCLAGAAIGAAGTVVGTAAGVAGTVVGATVKTTGAVVGAAIPDGDHHRRDRRNDHDDEEHEN